MNIVGYHGFSIKIFFFQCNKANQNKNNKKKRTRKKTATNL